MAAKKPAAAKGAVGSKPKANTKAKITKAPATKGKTPAAKGVLKAVKKMNGTTNNISASKIDAIDQKTHGGAKSSKTKATPTTAGKRKAEADLPAPAPKKAAPARKTAPPEKRVKVLSKGAVINEPPKQRLNVYVFGEGSAGELGLGTAKLAMDVKRPRLNPFLPADSVGVVQVSAGGMHVVALTHDNKILTWGVNDQGALGRDTEWEGGLRDMDADEDSEDEDENDNGLNPKESTPGQVDFSSTEIAEGSRWVQVVAGDSFTLALTDDGKVYGWGTFRSNEGILGFSNDVHIADRPILIPELKDIQSVKAGSNHALALSTKGAVFAWGSGQQNQLGRRVVERRQKDSLTPREFGLPKGTKNGVAAIETGAYHSFAISKNGDVYGWGGNSFGQTGIMENAGQDEGSILKPQIITALKGKKIVSIKGANHHSIAAAANGECLTWGRVDGSMLGLTDDFIAKLHQKDVERDDSGKPRIVLTPQPVASINGHVVQVAAASEHCVVVTKEGKAWSWGFSTNYQTGLGTTDTVVVPTLIDNTAVREKKLNGCQSGGQFGILTCPADGGL